MRMSSIMSAALRILIVAALFVIAPSCVHEWPEPADTQVVLNFAFNSDLPQGPVLDVSTRGAEVDQVYDVRYVIEAYRRKGNSYDETPYERFVFWKDDTRNLDNSFTLTILEGEYRFSVWSDYVLQDSQEDLHYNADSFKYIKLYGRDEGRKHVGNDDKRDAYIGSADVEVIRFGGNHPPVEATIDMTRPMGKVVIITTDLVDWKTKVLTNMYESSIQNRTPGSNVEFNDEVDLSQYTVKIHYPQYMPNAFNIMTDRTTWSDLNVSFDSEMIQLNENEASMGFDYVFSNKSNSNVVMAVSVYDKDGTQLARSYDITVPLERGKVTTVKGSFLLEESDGGVSINPDFDGEFNIII